MTSVFHVKIGIGGRLVIPVEARQKLHLDEGAEVVMEVDNQGLRIAGLQQTMKDVQEYFRQFVPEGVSVVDELLRERREEAARE
jgi:AbrB family looped-hinge helix DNA binding protein